MTGTACRRRDSRRLHARPGDGAGRAWGRCVAFLAHAFSVEDSHGACRVKNDVHAAVSFTLMLDAAAPLHRRRARRNECERERNERVVASKREPEEPRGGSFAAPHMERLEFVADPARRAEIAECARAFL